VSHQAASNMNELDIASVTPLLDGKMLWQCDELEK
jgi:hypothetical protein